MGSKHKNDKTLKRQICSLFFLFFASVVHAQEKVAVVVSAGDLNSLEESLQSIEKQAIRTYEQLGFKVVLIGGAGRQGVPLSPESLNRTLGDLRNVKDLRLDFIGHGSLQPLPASMKYDGPEIRVSTERRESGNEMIDPSKPGKLVWLAANASSADSAQTYYSHKANLLGLRTQELPPISHRRVSEALAGFRAQNPDAVTTVNLLNCFSGAMAQELRTAPNTVVYANSPHNEVALNLDERTPPGEYGEPGEFIRSTTGLGMYYEALESSREREPSLNTIRDQANRRMRQALIQDPSAWYMTGRSPVFESIIGWCEAGKAGKLATAWTDAPEAHRTAFRAAEEEMFGLRQSFDYSSRMPSPTNPKITYVDQMKEWDNECRKPESSGNQSSGSSFQELSGSQQISNANVRATRLSNRPLMRLFAKYEEVLNDPSQHAGIFERVKSSLENDKRKLRNSRLPEHRWGAIKDLMDGIENGSITALQVIERIKASVRKMKKDCSSGSPDRPPCVDHFGMQEEMAHFLVSARSSPSQCGSKQNELDCFLSGPLTIKAITTVQGLWSPGEQPKVLSIEDKCASQPYQAYMKTKSNVEQDEKCVDDFKKFAPDSEWSNLTRIYELGQRSARGRQPEGSGIRPHTAPAKPEGAVR